MSAIFYLIGVIGGAASALQSAANGRLGKVIGPLNAAVTSTAVGLASLVIYALVTRQLSIASIGRAPANLLVGGLLGAFFVTSIIYVVPRLGTVSAVMLAVLGQLVVAALADQFGLFGNARIGLSPARIVGIVLVGAGFALARS